MSSLIGSYFDKATPQEYWHYLAKNRSGDFYIKNEKKLLEKMREIGEKLENCSLDVQSHHRWTPLHVAVINQNIEATFFLLKHKANADILDEYQKKPMDYAQEKFSNELMKKMQSQFLSCPSSLLEDMERMVYKLTVECPEAFNISFVGQLEKPKKSLNFDLLEEISKNFIAPSPYLNSSPFNYNAETNDFGIELKELLFSRPRTTDDHILNNLEDLAKEEGFALNVVEKRYFARDQYIKIGDLTGIGNYDPGNTQLSVQRSISKAVYFGESAAFMTKLRYLNGTMGGTLHDRLHLGMSVAHPFSASEVLEIPIYLEGGNVLSLTNVEGRKKVLIGQDHFSQIQCQLRLSKYFDGKELPDVDLSASELEETLEEMYSLGLFRINNKNGTISLKMIEEALSDFQLLEEINPLSLKNIIIKNQLITDFESLRKDLKEDASSIAKKYIAQKSMVKDYLANLFNVPKEDLHFIPQLSFHLDIFLQPGPKGSVFFQDFELCIKLLNELKANMFSLNLGYSDYFMLARYQLIAQKLQKELLPLINKTKEELKGAGLHIIPMPAVFYDQHLSLKDQTYHINFLNAVTGWSEKNRHYFYMTGGAQVPESRVGALLMHVFSTFIKHYQPDIKVHFVGEDPQKPGNFHKAMELWNQVNGTLGSVAGIHCLSYEKSSTNHRE